MARVAEAAERPVERFFEFSLLGLLCCGYLAVASSGVLDLPTVLLTGFSLMLRAAMLSGWFHFTISEPWLTAITIAYIGFYPIDYAYVSRDFFTATVHLIFFLATIKVITARSNRDYFFLKVLGFIQLVAASVLSTSMSFFFFLGLFLLFTVATFTSSEIRRATQGKEVIVRSGLRRFTPRLLALTLVVTTGILFVSAGLFLVLPRTAQAAFLRFSTGRYTMAGFSSQITLGQVGELRQENTPVMHVKLPENARRDLKWRGIALSHFDGYRWTNAFQNEEIIKVPRGAGVRLADSVPGSSVSYEVTLRPVGSDMLFFAGQPEVVFLDNAQMARIALDSYRAHDFTSDLRYNVNARLPDRDQRVPQFPPEPLAPALRSAFTQLPPLDIRIERLAREVTAGSISDLERAQAIERHFRTRYGYTTKMLEQQVDDPLAYFIFDRRQGHCEYFASAMAVMLRTLQIPARVATGFQSGIQNPITGMQVIRMADAHAWVEAWIPRYGWVTFDPTPADRNAFSTSIGSRLALYLDTAETFWQDWVVNYDLERQLNLASSMRSSHGFSLAWFDPSRFLPSRSRLGELIRNHGWASLAGTAAVVALILFWPRLLAAFRNRQRVAKVKRGAVTASDATILYERMLACLKRRGRTKPPWITPGEFVYQIGAAPEGPLVGAITAEYHALRYGRETGAGPRMLTLIEQLESRRDLVSR